MVTNPYQPPNAAVCDSDPDKGRRRPKLVWLICIFLSIGVLQQLYIEVVGIQVPPNASVTVRGLLENRNIYDKIVALLGMGMTSVSVITLFRLRSVAYHLLWASVLLNIANTCIGIAFRPHFRAWLFDAEGGGLWIMPITLTVQLAMVYYAWHLKKRGVLKA